MKLGLSRLQCEQFHQRLTRVDGNLFSFHFLKTHHRLTHCAKKWSSLIIYADRLAHDKNTFHPKCILYFFAKLC